MSGRPAHAARPIGRRSRSLVTGLASPPRGRRARDGYRVRAVFDNAQLRDPGRGREGRRRQSRPIDDVDLTEDNRAVVVLQIDDPAFQPVPPRRHCQIRLQSLIGEQYVECEPTRRARGRRAAAGGAADDRVRARRGPAPAPRREHDHAGPVDLINEHPARCRSESACGCCINELGAGLAGNGERLRDAIRRANPALREPIASSASWPRRIALLRRLVRRVRSRARPWAAAPQGDRRLHRAAPAPPPRARAERGDDIERNFAAPAGLPARAQADRRPLRARSPTR